MNTDDWEYWIEVRAWEALAEIKRMADDAREEIDVMLGFDDAPWW